MFIMQKVYALTIFLYVEQGVYAKFSPPPDWHFYSAHPTFKTFSPSPPPDWKATPLFFLLSKSNTTCRSERPTLTPCFCGDGPTRSHRTILLRHNHVAILFAVAGGKGGRGGGYGGLWHAARKDLMATHVNIFPRISRSEAIQMRPPTSPRVNSAMPNCRYPGVCGPFGNTPPNTPFF